MVGIFPAYAVDDKSFGGLVGGCHYVGIVEFGGDVEFISAEVAHMYRSCLACQRHGVEQYTVEMRSEVLHNSFLDYNIGYQVGAFIYADGAHCRVSDVRTVYFIYNKVWGEVNVR